MLIKDNFNRFYRNSLELLKRCTPSLLIMFCYNRLFWFSQALAPLALLKCSVLHAYLTCLGLAAFSAVLKKGCSLARGTGAAKSTFTA
jgi:hypothetical protein